MSNASATPSRTARLGGFFWLMTIVTGVVAMVAGGKLDTSHGPATTAASLLSHESVYRAAIAADLLATASYVAATLFVYELLKPVSRSLSLLAAFFSLVGCSGGAVSFALRLGALAVLQGAPLVPFDAEQQKALASVLLRLPVGSYTFLFFGLHVLLVGVLVFRSTFLPRFVGALMVLGGLGWLTFSLSNLLSPPLARSLSPYIMVPGILGETTLTLWLLVKGVNVQRFKERLAMAMTLLLCFLLGSPAALAAGEPDLVAAGRAALDHGDIDGAVAQLEKAVAAKPNDARAHYHLGAAYSRQGMKAGMLGGMSLATKAKDEWLRAVELDPAFVDARMALIDFYVMAPGMMGGSEEKAREQAAEIAKRDPLDGHRAQARLYTGQKKLDLATAEMARAVKEQPKSAKAHYHLGNAFLNQSDWKRSLEEYETAISLDAAYMPAWFRVGQVAARSESNYVRGEEALRKYLAYKPAYDEPGLARAWYWLGTIQEKQGKKAEARTSYQNAEKLTPDAKDVGEALKRVP